MNFLSVYPNIIGNRQILGLVHFGLNYSNFKAIFNKVAVLDGFNDSLDDSSEKKSVSHKDMLWSLI